jgi:signal transduction histidine kinase
MPRLTNSLLHHLLTLVYLAAMPHHGFSQRKYTVEHYTADNGLPQNTIKSIAADRLGFLWLATDAGLVRFDGRHFQTLTNRKLGLTNAASVYCIEASGHTREPRLSGSKNDNRFDRGFAIYDSGESVRIENGKATRDTTYIAHYLHVRKKFAPKKDPYSVSGIPDVFGAVIPQAGVAIPDGSGDGSFYLCQQDSVTQFTKWRMTTKTASKVDNLLTYFVQNKRLYHFNKVSRSFLQIYQGRKRHFDLKGDIITHPSFKQAGQDIGLYWNPNSSQAFLRLSNSLYLLADLPDGTLSTTLLVEGVNFTAEDIDVVFYDQNSNKLFLGSGISGLFVLTLPSFESVTIRGKDRPNIFQGQIAFDSTHILTPNGILLGRSENGSIERQEKTALRKANPDDKRVIIRDRQGNIWTKNRKTLIKMAPDAEKVISRIPFPDLITAICLIGDSKICVGVYNKGLFVMDLHAAIPKMHLLRGNYSKKISSLSFRGRDQLLVGTENGLFQLNLAQKTSWPIEGTEGLSIRSINSIAYDDVWIIAQSKGLMTLTNDKSSFTFPVDQNGYLVSAHCTMDDNLGYLWITTNQGLFQIRKDDLTAYYRRYQNSSQGNPPSPFYLLHRMSEGFNTNEFTGGCSPCGLRQQNGGLSLPSLNGLVWFNPANLRPVLPSDDIVLDRVEASMNTIEHASDTIVFPLSPENIRFDFSTAYSGDPLNLDLSYALVTLGSDSTKLIWKPLPQDDMAVQWSTLGAGKFVLMMRKRAGFGLDNEVIKKVYLIVPEVWYATTWALILFAILGLIFVVMCTQYYSRKKIDSIKKEKLALEQVVMSRTESLRTTLAQLEESNAVVTDQMFVMSRMLASISHDVQSPLNFVAFSSAEIPCLIEQKQFAEASKVTHMIASVAERTGRMLQDILNYIKIQVYGKRVRMEDISIKNLIQEKLELFKNVIDQKNNRVTFCLSQDLVVHNDYQLLSIVIHNLIDNATKYTRDGEISFDAEVRSELRELTISNTGLPLPPDTVALFNDPDTPAHYPNGLEGSGNLGLIIVKEVAELIGVKISISQTEKINFHLRF